MPPWHLDAMLQTVDASGAQWSFVDTGGGGKAVILLPGSVGTCELFFKQVAALRGEFRVIAASYPPLTDPGALADALAGFITHLGVQPALVAGSSFAGHWLQFFALRHPERSGRLLLCNAFLTGEALRAHPLFDPALVLDGPADTLQRTWHAAVMKAPDSELRSIQLDMLSGRQSAATLQSRLAGALPAVACPPIPHGRLSLLECDDDGIITPAMRRDLRERYAGAAVHVLPSGGHYPHLLNADAFNAVLRLELNREQNG